jgi:endonuclease YncB( thermonuclease family)
LRAEEGASKESPEEDIVWRVMLWVLAFSSVLLSAPVSLASPPRTVHASVERVSDGDTVIATSENDTKRRIRLLGIDAPEISHSNRQGQPYGAEARQYLTRLVMGRPVRLELFGPDAHRRLLAVLWVGDTNVNVEMVRIGLAEVYRGGRCHVYCRELTEAEAAARQQRVGVWALERYESPAAYRRRMNGARPG